MDGQALAQLRRYFGYSAFRPAQEKPVTALLNNEDVLAIMPTGAGKSICFQIPSLCKPGLTIVFSPLISLMHDQVEGLRLQNVPATYLNSTLQQEDYIERMRGLRAGQYKLLYLAPERLGSERFCEFLRQLPLSQVIIDEAHCVSQWGHDFRPSYTLIKGFVDSLPKRPVIGAFTASATKEVEEDMIELLGLKNAKIYVTGFDRPNLSFHVVKTAERMEYLVDYVRRHSQDVGVIYCATRKDVENVYSRLLSHRIAVGYYHAGLSDEIRKAQQEAYAYDKVQVMVATNAFGMGIDKSNVRYVLHYQMPRNMESYYQEAGRAGRDGAPAECVLLYSGRDIMVQRYLIDQSELTEERRFIELSKLQSMVDYCNTSQCLRKYMLNYFGESVDWQECHNCSSCLNPAEKVDMTDYAIPIFNAIYETDSRYGVTMLAAIVCGQKTERVVHYHLDRLPMFGQLAKMGEKEVKSFIRQLVTDGYLESSGGKYPVLRLAYKANEVLCGRGRVIEKKQQVVASPKARARTSSANKGWDSVKTSKGYASLFERLRKERSRLAREAGVPPYLVFPDTVLIDMARRRPKSLSELQNIKGIGEAKLARYGQAFLSAILGFKGE